MYLCLQSSLRDVSRASNHPKMCPSLLCAISIVHNHGLQQMAQHMSYGICYLLVKQAYWPFAMDACGKLENVERKAMMGVECIHYWWCWCGD